MGQKPDTSTRRLADIVKRFDNAILVTRNDSAPVGLHGRPMSIAKVDGDADLWFITSIDAPKSRELEAHPEALVTLQGPSTYVVLQGIARVSQDRAKIDELWDKTYDVWFPNGKDDPDVAVVHVTISAGEFWDLRPAKRVKYLWEAAKAWFRHDTPKDLGGIHGTVKQEQAPTSAGARQPS